jgi:hypothetical protein
MKRAADRAAFDPRQRRVDAEAEAGAQLQQRAGVRDAPQGGAAVVDAQPVLWNDIAQCQRIGGSEGLRAALEERQVVARGCHRLHLVVDQHVDHAVAVLDVARADLLRPEGAEPAAFDHCRAAHADVAGAGGDDHVAATEQRRIPGEAPSRHNADHRHLAAQARVACERGDVQPRHDRHVRVAGTSAAALREQHHRQFLRERDAQHAVGLLVVAHALRPGQHGGVVRHHDGACGIASDQGGVHGADAGDHAVGGRVAHQVRFAPAAALRRDGQGAVFEEGARVA